MIAPSKPMTPRRKLLAGMLALLVQTQACAMPAEADIDTALERHAVALHSLDDVTPIVDAIGGAHTVLLGEATHGTQEFYRLRALISRELVRRKGFDAVVIEAEWPATARADRFARGEGADETAEQALSAFERFPRWMWRNTEMRDWLDWLRAHNRSLSDRGRHARLYGFDLQNLRGSIEAVVAHLETRDPPAAARARERFACFGPHADKPERYGRAGAFGLAPRCESPVAEQVREMMGAMHAPATDVTRAARPTVSAPVAAPIFSPASSSAASLKAAEATSDAAALDARFDALQNARAVQAAEAYYRAAGSGRTGAWNVRDAYMADTLDALRAHLSVQRGRPAKIVVWAHNSHVGDARAVTRAGSPEIESSLGQLVRMRAGRETDVMLVGLTTHEGSVTAAPAHGEPPRRMPLSPSLAGSVERAFHDGGVAAAMLVPLRGNEALRRAFSQARLQRAVGVVYRPQAERTSHYTRAVLARQYDAVIHIDVTQALQPLP